MHMQINARALEKALPAVAGFIADSTGIEIRRDEHAETDGKVIYLPKRSDEITLGEHDLVKNVAYLYHEAGHILYSDFDLDFDSPLQKMVSNILEDIRVEQLMIAKFPAARRYLSRLMGMMTEESGGMVPAEASQSEAVILQQYMLHRLRHDVLRQDVLAEVLTETSRVAHEKLPVNMLARLEALMFQVSVCEDTRDTVALANAIITMIQEEKQKEQEAQQEQQPEPHASSQQDGQMQAGQGGQQDQNQNAQSSGQNGQQQANADALDRILNMAEEEMQQGLGEKLQQEINASARGAKSHGNDRYVVMPDVCKAILSERPIDLDGIRRASNAIRTGILQWMSSVAEAEVRHTRSGMSIDASRLWGRKFGIPIFCQEDEGIDLNAAVSIVIDRSGSMSGRIQQAAQAAVAMMLAYDVPGIKTQVTVFPWDRPHRDVGVAIVKDWDETARKFAGRITSLSADGGTPMAEAIMAAAANIVRRDETLKAIMVITDGIPDDLESTRHMIEYARNNGIKVLGVGIGVETAPVFDAPFSVTISSIDGLASSMIGLIRRTFEDRRTQ
jgi:hypothetical protein